MRDAYKVKTFKHVGAFEDLWKSDPKIPHSGLAKIIFDSFQVGAWIGEQRRYSTFRFGLHTELRVNMRPSLE